MKSVESPDCQFDNPVKTIFLDADSCAARYGFSPMHWRRLVDAGKAPSPRRFGRLVRWAETDLDQWDADGNLPIRRVKGGAK